MLIEEICQCFQIKGDYIGCEILCGGHINTTFLVSFLREGVEKKYIVQKVNKFVFKHPDKVMSNISKVTEYIRNEIKKTEATSKNKVLHYLTTLDGEYYTIDEKHEYWRCYRFIDDSVTFDNPNDLQILNECGKAFGIFQNYLNNFKVEDLYITIPNFHNSINRYNLLRKSIRKDKYKRYKKVKWLCDELFAIEDIVTTMTKMQQKGRLRTRVTHNDTKCNNVLYSKNDLKYLTVIDLDTIMPGLVGFDYGDAIRYSCNNSKEDETNLKKVFLDFDKFKSFSTGFLENVKDSLTKDEINTLTLGAITMTAEVAVRFITDYLDGDVYFRIYYPGQNYFRARCQLKLAKDMIDKKDLMDEIVNNIIQGE